MKKEKTKTVSLQVAIKGKRDKLVEVADATTFAELAIPQPANVTELRSLYSQFKVGKYENLERIRVSYCLPGTKWPPADLFNFIPKQSNPFTFVRHTNERISPRNMVTDIGSVPRLAGLFRRGLTAWGYAPAYIVHDWEFEAHHCGVTEFV